MPDHEFIVKTMEFDWFVFAFSGVHLTGEFFINGSVRIPGQAVLTQRENVGAGPGENTAIANFQGGTPPRLAVEFVQSSQSLPLLREVIWNDWKGFTIFFEHEQLDPNSTGEVSVTFKHVRFYRTF